MLFPNYYRITELKNKQLIPSESLSKMRIARVIPPLALKKLLPNTTIRIIPF